MYLTIVHMWNKQFSFPLVTTKDPNLNSCQVDDGAGDNISNLRSPSPSPYSTKVTSNRQEDTVLTAQRAKFSATMDKILIEMQQSQPDEHERGEMDVVGRQH